ncbi:ankyrin repeat, PH and SEC7 domain containing protein secG-like [Argopecten irradians]|uniref:ankyrin repeat, PH and SEC7 domain containing protein secG-like n=1 Tax=Argopecten irradians TaxID=31199 RepID=UPI003715BB69
MLLRLSRKASYEGNMETTKSNTEHRNISEMSKSELEMYRHGPETELSSLVCHASESGDFTALRDYLQILSDTEPEKINQTDKAGMTALHFAVSCQNLHAVSMLIRHGADVGAQDVLGFTPLFLATGRYPNVEVAKYLLTEGKSDVNVKTHSGATPLHGASLQGNIECLKLLLEWNGDPRIEDEDGTTPFELAKDDKTKAVLHDAIIVFDAKRDTVDAICAWCKQIPKAGLKRCGRCHVTMYCQRECQVKHWKEGGHRIACSGFVVARPFHANERKGQGIQTSFYRVMGSTKPNVKVFMRNASEAPQKMEFLRNKRFVVKVQVPIGNLPCGEMMVYNADRTVEGFVYTKEKGYDILANRIRTEGFMGVKAFFWAELTGVSDGSFRIFHGRCAPYQQW